MKTYDELFTLITQRGVHEVFGGAGEDNWGIESNADELARFLVEMQALGVASVLEIGTGYMAGLARFLHDDLGYRVTSVDIQNYGHAYAGIDFVHPRDFDHDAVDEAYDLVLIDADHTYEGVKDDHEFYAPYAAKVVAFHDIAGLRECEGVRQYWEEIAHGGIPRESMEWVNPGYHEIIADGEQRGGIGYVVLSDAEPVLPVFGTPDMFAIKHDSTKIAELLATKDKPPAKKPAPRKRAPAKKATVKK